MKKHGEPAGGDQQFESQSEQNPKSEPKSTSLGESGCVLSNRSQHRLGIARMLNKDKNGNAKKIAVSNYVLNFAVTGI